MDVPSYILGKSRGGGGTSPILIEKNININGTYNASDDEADGYKKVVVNVPQPSGTINITSNGTVNVTDYASANVNVAPDMSEYISNTITSGDNFIPGFSKSIIKLPDNMTISGNSLFYAFRGFKGTALPSLNTSSVTNMSYCCKEASSLQIAPSWDTSHCTTIRNMFEGCFNLKDVPVYDWSGINDSYGLYYVFGSCNALTDTSLDNILQSCISATSYNGTKTLANLSLIAYNSRVPNLPHYQDFLDAGWTIN